MKTKTNMHKPNSKSMSKPKKKTCTFRLGGTSKKLQTSARIHNIHDIFLAHDKILKRQTVLQNSTKTMHLDLPKV